MEKQIAKPKYYKILNKDGKSTFQNCEWHLPTKDKPGKWMPYLKGELVGCIYGYHICTINNLLHWYKSECRIFEVETKHQVITFGDKSICRQARLVKEVQLSREGIVSFAADCAAAVLHIFEEKFPKDKRPRKAIEAARDWIKGKAAAAANAAYAAAVYATGAASAASAAAVYAAAAADAASAADAADAAYAASAAYAAYAAAVYATDAADAASAAAVYAVSQEKEWQAQKLLEYLK